MKKWLEFFWEALRKSYSSRIIQIYLECRWWCHVEQQKVLSVAFWKKKKLRKIAFAFTHRNCQQSFRNNWICLAKKLGFWDNKKRTNIQQQQLWVEMYAAVIWSPTPMSCQFQNGIGLVLSTTNGNLSSAKKVSRFRAQNLEYVLPPLSNFL